MTLLPLHLPPRTKLKAVGSLKVSLKHNKSIPAIPNVEKASDKFFFLRFCLCAPGAAPSQDGNWSSSSFAVLAPKEFEWVFVGCLHTSDGAETMFRNHCKPPPAALAIAGAVGRLRLNKWLLLKELDWQAGAFSKMQMRRSCSQFSP